MKFDKNMDVGALVSSLGDLKKLKLERVNPVMLIAAGAVLLLILTALLFLGGGSQNDNERVLARAKQTMSQVSGAVQDIRRVLEDKQVQELSVIALADADKLPNLEQYVRGRIPELLEMRLFEPELNLLRGEDLGPFGYAVLDMLMGSQGEGLAPLQLHGKGEESYMALATRIGEAGSESGYLFVKLKPEAITSVFTTALPSKGAFALDQYNGRFTPTQISKLAKAPNASETIMWLRIPGALLRVGVVQAVNASPGMGILRPLLFVAGVLMLFLGLMLKIRPYKPPVELEEDPVQIEQDNRAGEESDQAADIEEQSMKPAGIDADDGLGVIDLPDLGFTLEQPNMPHIKAAPPVELVESIFRAYDIRGIVGETLDADVARQVGQVVGSLTLEQEAGPVIVARDGRDSGPDLVDGMIEGISSTGCDVVDIGAVPTGVLYFAAYELGNGTGVMITGSHNPSNYNGFKILIGGVTQAGDQITDMFNRIQSGNLRVGKGQVSREDVLDQFRERISGDIQLKRPLKVVADCGNGIGGICAADVLRDIGAEVIPLFDEVDGSFPNHHPDPSEPENLKDLIESVQLMEADIGIAFDGDADRLGVVTADGEIIYSDRLMMLFVKDVLGRVPGSTIIYDVKCTGHLHDVIEQAGGKAMMYKTGHSLIKNKMRDVDSPFAGEMSGHFFFKERWYGFDCGIYSAARLLEILAADELSPSDVLSGLPSSVSTPELKVKMEEGENHAFVVELQDKARFENAKINTIDGVRADFSDGWGLVRASNTTPILVCRFDADNEEALQRIKDDFKKQMLAINEDLDLPF
jgi:phosphomannomutase/phosphoglucomutase